MERKLAFVKLAQSDIARRIAAHEAKSLCGSAKIPGDEPIDARG